MTELIYVFCAFPWVRIAGSKVNALIVDSSIIIMLSTFCLVKFVEPFEFSDMVTSEVVGVEIKLL